MGLLADEAEVCRLIGGLMRDVLADPELGPAIRSTDTVVQYRCREPEATLTVDGRRRAEPRVDCGESDLEPDVVFSGRADALHRFWLGELNVTIALARGDVRADGPVVRVLRLLPQLEPAFARYRRRLREAGREDLLATD